MESNTTKNVIELSLEALKKAEPFPISYLDELGYDDPRWNSDNPDKDRITATMAKKFLIEHGYKFD